MEPAELAQSIVTLSKLLSIIFDVIMGGTAEKGIHIVPMKPVFVYTALTYTTDDQILTATVVLYIGLPYIDTHTTGEVLIA